MYWERQGSDCLCALHCLNALLQGPHFTAGELAEIAQELDGEERRLLRGQGLLSPSAANVDVRGNFSSQVLFRALQRWGNLHAVDSRHKDVRTDILQSPEREVGYICNLRRHWVALRRVPWNGGRDAWFNLNSRGEGGPTKVGEDWLASFLESACADRDTIFVVRGKYQLPSPELLSAPLESHQMFLDEEGLRRLQTEELERQAAEVRWALAPQAELASLPVPVPEQWQVIWSDAQAAYYYWNTTTGVTQWEHPTEHKLPDGAVASRSQHV